MAGKSRLIQPGCDAGASSGFSEGAGDRGGAGGSSGGDGQGQSGQMTKHMGALLAVGSRPPLLVKLSLVAGAVLGYVSELEAGVLAKKPSA